MIAVSYLPYERFLRYLPSVLPLMDNWAICDSFKAKCITKHKREFLSHVAKIHATGKEFFVRYALVVLLNDYVEEEYLPTVLEYLRKTDCRDYYVHMAAAWLTAEVLVKHFEVGVAFLQENSLDVRTHNKSIQKANESYRLTKEQKEFLKTLKIKNSKVLYGYFTNDSAGI
jgi:3-methyladenine DNA glycosylase AlkD